MMQRYRFGGSEPERQAFLVEFASALDAVQPPGVPRELFLLAVIEAVNNAAEHGLKDVPGGTIQVRCLLLPHVALVAIRDEGWGFTPDFADLAGLSGPRGRGLGLIRANADAALHNIQGNELVIVKGGETMRVKTKNVEASISHYEGGVSLVSNLKFGDQKINVAHGLSELFEGLPDEPERLVFINLAQVRLVSSLGWGSLFAAAEQDRTHLVVLFNANEAILKTAEQMGISERGGFYAKIRIFPDCDAPMHLLAERLASSTKA